MGGRTEVDPGRLRSVADRVMQAADSIAEMHWPGIDSGDMRGSAIARAAAHDLIPPRLTDLVAKMRRWSVAAHTAVDALERADHGNGERLGR